MAEKTIKAPVTVFYNGEYVPPGTEITLPEAEANALIARHGEYDGPIIDDKSGKQAAADQASIDALNQHAAIYKGHGIPPGGGAHLTRAGLEILAADRGIAVPAGASKADIVKLLEVKAA